LILLGFAGSDPNFFDSFGEVKNITYAADDEWRRIATDASNALIDGEIWRVSSRAVFCSDPSIAPLVTTNITQVSGLSLTNESRNVSIDVRGNASESWSEFDPAMTKRISYACIPTATNIALEESIDGATVLSVSHSAVTNTAALDAYRREVERTDGRGNATTNAYDTLGRLASVTDPLGATTRYAYDTIGNLVAVTNALGNATIYEYDIRGNMTYEGGATYPVRYTYDDFNVMTNMTTFRNESLQSGDTTTWLYDEPTGLLTNKVYPDGKCCSCSYTVDGRLQSKTEASGRWKEFLYNAWGELANTIYSDGEIISTLRDTHGREVLETNNVASILKWRDEFGNVTNETISVGAESLVVERLYDDEGRAACLASGLCIGYDASGRYSILSNNEAIVQYAYNSDSNEAGYTISLSNGIVFARNVYRDSEHPERIAAISNCVNGALVENFDYTYDLLGRPVVRNCDTFDYNPRSEVVFSRRGVANADDGYAYDDIGNLLVSCVGANTNSYSANNLNQYTSILHVSAPSSEDYLFYDLDGNLTNDSVFAYSYDAQNRIVSVLSNDVALLVNEYDSKSRRVRKITQEATTTFFYDDWNLIEERIARTNGTTSTIKYYWGKDLSGTLQGTGGVGGLLYLTISNSNLPLQLYIPCYDNIGNVTRYLDANGNAVAQYTYNAFGNIISKSGPLADFFRHRFSTKYFNAESNLYYYGYRFYSPELMRWITRDPIGEEGGVNLYAFCENGSTFLIDATGLTKYWDKYMNFKDYTSGHVWKQVGGNLYWGYLSGIYYDSCALRVSRTLILNGHSPKQGKQRNVNRDYVILKEIVSPDGVVIPKGKKLKAESNGKRYVISAHAIGSLLDECLTDPTVKKLKWRSEEEAKKLRACIEKEDGEAFFAANGHAGMIKKGYTDSNFPYKPTGRIWRIK
jgi:RHS repeat-associated protein